MKQTNFHTHTSRCHHAFGNDEEFVRTAIQNGFEVLGFYNHNTQIPIQAQRTKTLKIIEA